MDKTSIYDDLRRIESDLVEWERRLAEQERLIVGLKQQNQDPTKAESELEMMLQNRRQQAEDRLRLLSLLQLCSP